MSYTKRYLEFITEARGPSRADSSVDFGEFGPQDMQELPTKSFGDKYEIHLLDVDTLPDYLFRKSGKGPGTLNQSVVIYGRPGVGKSAIVKYTAQDVAKAVGREFVDFNRLYSRSKDELLEKFNNPEKYYCFIDIRAGAYEAFEFKGIPKPSETIKGTAEALNMLWIKMLTMENSAGMLFLDEINQASPETQNAMYPLLHFGERSIAEQGISNSDFWAVHAAGNLGAKFAGTNDLNKALVNRVSTVYFDVTFEKWSEFAKKFTKTELGTTRQVYHPLIIKFLNFKYSSYPDQIDTYFSYEDDDNVRTGDPNPRNFEKLSDSIFALQKEFQERAKQGKPTNKFISLIEEAARGDINVPWASEFMYYVRRYQGANIDQMLKAPEKYFVTKDKENPQGVETKDLFLNLSILQDRINGFVGEYVTAFGYDRYLTSSALLNTDMKKGTLPKPDPKEVDIQAYNDYAMSFFNAIEAMRVGKQQQNAAIVYSYLKSALLNGVEAWPIMQVAITQNATPEDKQKIKTFISTTAAELNGKIQAAEKSLNRLKKDSQSNYSNVPSGNEEEAEDQATSPIGIDVPSLNDTLEGLFAVQDKLAKKL
jgi:hypothetical protein